MGLFGDLLSEVAKTAVAAAAEGAAAGMVEGISNRSVQSNEGRRRTMENTIDYIPTYLEYTEIIHSYIEDQIEKFGLDDIGRKELIRLGLLDACSRYYDILEDATEDRHNDNWKNCFEGTCAFLDAIGVDGDDRKELVQVIKMVGGSIFVIYKRMRQDIESNAIKMWAGPVRCFRGYLEGNRADPAVDFRQALAMFLYCIRDEDIVLKALNSEYVAKVKLQMYS